MITVLGAGGFIGSQIVKLLQRNNTAYYAPSRNEMLKQENLGDIIYCIGLTADFRSKPFETVEAHVCKLNGILSHCSFSSLTYLSSTRVYINSASGMAAETDKIMVDPMNAEDLYTLTKLTGERLCLSSGKNTKIARMSNVVGKSDVPANFLSQVINDIQQKGEVELHQTLSSAKDYIFIDDAVELLINIALYGKEKIYNVASGINTTNVEIVENLQKYFSFNVEVNAKAREVIFPLIINDKICSEFRYTPKKILEQLKMII